MPYTLAWEGRGAWKQYSGRVTGADLRAASHAVFDDPRFEDLRYLITDCRQVEAFDVARDVADEVAAMYIGPLLTNTRFAVAVIAERDDLISYVTQAYENRFIDYPFGVFPGVDQARQWIAAEAANTFATTRPARLAPVRSSGRGGIKLTEQ